MSELGIGLGKLPMKDPADVGDVLILVLDSARVRHRRVKFHGNECATTYHFHRVPEDVCDFELFEGRSKNRIGLCAH